MALHDEEIVLFEKTLERILSNLTNERGYV